MLGYEVPCIISSGDEAVKRIGELAPDLILMDIKLKGNIDGIEATKRIYSQYDIPVIFLTAFSDEVTLQKIKSTENEGYILKPFKEAELGTTIEMALHKHKKRVKTEFGIEPRNIKRLNKIIDALLQTVIVIADVKDVTKTSHPKDVARLSAEIAKELGLNEEQVNMIYISAFLHDIGEIFVPIQVLSKPSKLTENEIKIMQTHVQKGYDILKEIEFPFPIAKIIQQHHERLDGSGYPFGLKSDDIMLEAKIIAVADVVEAMCHKRPYRDALSIDNAFFEIISNRGKLYENLIVDACLKVFKEKNFAF
jgi:putative nucleotidyltransferase with HDIG domain